MAPPIECPDKFYLVCAFCDQPPEGSNGITDDTRLLLYALHEQATKGPCRTPRPWAMFESMDQLKWDAWRTLEDMPALEAMQLYCKSVELDNPMWWELLTVDLDAPSKRVLIATAADCALEYYEAVAVGTLMPPTKNGGGGRGRPRAAAAGGEVDFAEVDASIAELKRELAELEAGGKEGDGEGGDDEDDLGSSNAKGVGGSDYLEQLRAERRAARGGSGGESAATPPKSPKSPRPQQPPPPADGGDSFSLTDLRSRIDALADLRAGGTGIVATSPKGGHMPAAAAGSAVTISNNDPSYAGMLHKLKFLGGMSGGDGDGDGDDDAAAAAAAAEAAGVNPPAASPLDDVTAMLTWTAPPVHGAKPVARYQHCAWRHGSEMWISHGSMNGRKLARDTWPRPRSPHSHTCRRRRRRRLHATLFQASHPTNV